MTAAFGCCVPADGSASPAMLAGYGVRWIRLTANPGIDIRGYLALCKAAGIKVILCFDGDALGHDPSGWQGMANHYGAEYGDLVSVWECGNEPENAWDGQRSLEERQEMSPASWVMEPSQLNGLLWACRSGLGAHVNLICGGLSSGQPDYLNGVDLGNVDGIALHSYGRRPRGSNADYPWVPGNFGTLAELFDKYTRFQLPTYLTEYNPAASSGQVNRANQAVYVTDSCAELAQQPGLVAATWFCWSDAMVADLGLMDTGGKPKPSALAFKKAAGGILPAPTPIPTPTPIPPTPAVVTSGPGGAWIGGGLLAALNARGLTPITGEIGGESGTAIVYCTGGVKVRWNVYDGRAYIEKMEAA